jgi:hypothetical protein
VRRPEKCTKSGSDRGAFCTGRLWNGGSLEAKPIWGGWSATRKRSNAELVTQTSPWGCSHTIDHELPHKAIAMNKLDHSVGPFGAPEIPQKPKILGKMKLYDPDCKHKPDRSRAPTREDIEAYCQTSGHQSGAEKCDPEHVPRNPIRN